MTHLWALLKMLYRCALGVLFRQKSQPEVQVEKPVQFVEPVMPPNFSQPENEKPKPVIYTFRLYDAFGSICYEGKDYNEGMQKARLLPYTAFMKAFNEDDEPVAVVWAAPEYGLIVTNINTLIPN